MGVPINHPFLWDFPLYLAEMPNASPATVERMADSHLILGRAGGNVGLQEFGCFIVTPKKYTCK